MKKYLLKKDGNFYKANLHCHTNVSDGCLSPEQIKEAYKKKGYSIVAYTDHDVFIAHPELTDKNFLALNGFEMEINEESGKSWGQTRATHLCFIALSPDNLIHPCWHRSKYLFANALHYRDQVRFDENKPDFERSYTPECINALISEGRKNGFFVTYNHPAWSLDDYEIYSRYHGMNAMEIYNYGCICLGFEDCVPHVYDDFLRKGEKLFCIGADDNHNKHPLDSRHSDSFGAFTMIKAENLDYKSVTDALINGSFYASQGPEIYELYYENQHIYLTCSNVDSIRMNTGIRHAVTVYDESGAGITQAVFRVDNPNIDYVRFTIMDKQGKQAHTNAYFYKDFVNVKD